MGILEDMRSFNSRNDTGRPDTVRVPHVDVPPVKATAPASAMARIRTAQKANQDAGVVVQPKQTTWSKRGPVMRDPNASANDRQIGLVYVLLKKLDTHNPDIAATARPWFEATREGMTMTGASRVIDRLRAQLAAPSMPGTNSPAVEVAVKVAKTYDPYIDVPNGYYAVPDASEADRIHYYRVSRRTVGMRDYVNVQEMASDELYPVRPWQRANGVLEAIRAAGPRDAATLFGTTIGRCCRCGRTLTDADSRAAGIGPDCAGKGMF